MAEPNLAHILRLSQQLTYKLNEVNHLISKAWLDLELARETLRNLSASYEQWLVEKNIDHEGR